MDRNEEQLPDLGDKDVDQEPWHGSELERELHALRALSNPQSRGYKLENLLERAFRRAHFYVVHNATMAGPRQTDFAVIARDHRYLAEVKWENRQAGTNAIGGLRDRLGRGDRAVVGVLFTMLGINEEGINDVVTRREHGLVLVFDEADILAVLKDPHELERLLRLKHDELTVHGRLHLGAEYRQARRSRRRKPESLPESHYRLLNTDGSPMPWFHGAGDFGSTVFCLDLPDVDWVPAAGSGVCLDMPVPAWDQPELLRLFDELNDLGWVTDRGHWSIQQRGRNWYGTGLRSFVEALKGWKTRTDELENAHHSEEFVYFEACDGGFYTVSGNISAHRIRRIARCNVSFQLVGVPLDPSSLQQLYRRFEVPSRGSFRPLVERSVTRHSLERRIPLEVLGYIVESSDLRWDSEDWVVGLLVANPYQRGDRQPPEDWPDDLRTSGAILCSLRSHHPLTELKERYELWSLELARTSDAHALCVSAEWAYVEHRSLNAERPAGAEIGAFAGEVVEVLTPDLHPRRPPRRRCGQEDALPSISSSMRAVWPGPGWTTPGTSGLM